MSGRAILFRRKSQATGTNRSQSHRLEGEKETILCTLTDCTRLPLLREAPQRRRGVSLHSAQVLDEKTTRQEYEFLQYN